MTHLHALAQRLAPAAVEVWLVTLAGLGAACRVDRRAPVIGLRVPARWSDWRPVPAEIVALAGFVLLAVASRWLPAEFGRVDRLVPRVGVVGLVAW